MSTTPSVERRSAIWFLLVTPPLNHVHGDFYFYLGTYIISQGVEFKSPKSVSQPRTLAPRLNVYIYFMRSLNAPLSRLHGQLLFAILAGLNQKIGAIY